MSEKAATARARDSECLCEDGGFVGAQVHHPIGDDHVSRAIGMSSMVMIGSSALVTPASAWLR